MDLNIMEITYINELALTVGLLTIGNFLGGQWAESWGRYWGWDPKETWALSIMVYAFVIHSDLYLLCVENGCLT
jgi:ABC-type transport system involved in cytochrome c biogenesis permease subunit